MKYYGRKHSSYFNRPPVTRAFTTCLTRSEDKKDDNEGSNSNGNKDGDAKDPKAGDERQTGGAAKIGPLSKNIDDPDTDDSDSSDDEPDDLVAVKEPSEVIPGASTRNFVPVTKRVPVCERSYWEYVRTYALQAVYPEVVVIPIAAAPVFPEFLKYIEVHII
jgi:hypothetical protein